MCDSCGWEDYLGLIEETIDKIEDLPEKAEDFGYSVLQTLEGIQGWVSSKGHITDGQKAAVDNIAGGVDSWL